MSKSQSALSSPWVRGWIALFLVFVSANVVFIYLALTNNPGLVVEDYYQRGQDYEKHMLTRLANAPGWQMNIQVPTEMVQGQPARFGFELNGAHGETVTPDQVMLRAYRPANADDDFDVPMAALRSGYFEADVSFPLPGVWDLLVTVHQGEQEASTPLRIRVGQR